MWVEWVPIVSFLILGLLVVLTLWRIGGAIQARANAERERARAEIFTASALNRLAGVVENLYLEKRRKEDKENEKEEHSCATRSA